MIDAETIACWRINYAIDSRGPEHAARWWNDMNNGNAPAGAVAALGLCLEEIENHAAFVARVREIAEGMGHGHRCPADEYFHKGDWLIRETTDDSLCTCPRGQLLEALNG